MIISTTNAIFRIDVGVNLAGSMPVGTKIRHPTSLHPMAVREDLNGRLEISEVQPAVAIAGGEFYIRGKNLAAKDRPHVTIDDVPAGLVIGSNSLLVVRVPERVSAGDLVVENGEQSRVARTCNIGIQVAENLHQVTSPAIDSEGNIYTTFSGSPGQKVPVAVYRVDLNFNLIPFVNNLVNATGVAVGSDGLIYISSCFDGMIYRVTPTGNLSVFVEGMGSATGIVFDEDNNLYVGDYSGTVFKISPSRQIYVLATLERSISAYHLAWGPDQHLYVSGPTTSSFDCIYRVADNGNVETFYRGLGHPRGMAFDAEGNLYSSASHMGRKGVVRITKAGNAELFVSGPGIVGLAFSAARAMIISTTNAIFRIDVGVRGSQAGLRSPL
jgi:sugar lactone lactonase YvrE